MDDLDEFLTNDTTQDLDKYAFKFAVKILNRGVLGTPSHLSDTEQMNPFDMTLSQEVDVNLRNLNNALYKLQLQAGEAASDLHETTRTILEQS